MNILKTFVAASALVLASSVAHAATMLVGVTVTSDDSIENALIVPQQGNDKNDCTGFFGTASSSMDSWCDVGRGLEEEVSPWIVKLDPEGEVESEGDELAINGFFSSITGDEFELFYNDGSDSSGTWTYTPGDDDPAVRFWSAKGSAEFTLWWYVSEDSSNCQSGAHVDNYDIDCLNEAISVFGGEWATPGAGLSHIVFYDTGMTPIPLPAAGWLLLGGLGGLYALRRRRKH